MSEKETVGYQVGEMENLIAIQEEIIEELEERGDSPEELESTKNFCEINKIILKILRMKLKRLGE